MQKIVETERLWLREFTLHDAPFICRLLNTEGWLTFIGDRNVKTQEQAEQYLQTGPIKSYATYGFGLWLVELKETNIGIGMCGILKRDFLLTPDIGFAFLPEFNGKGYAYEAAAATIDFVKQHLHIPVIAGITVAHNSSSIKLLEKIGLKFIETISTPHKKEKLLLYSN